MGIHVVANYKTNVQLERQTAAFLKGLQCVLPLAWLKMFDPYELNMLISGSSTGFDVRDLELNTVYSGGYSENSPTIQWLWELLRNHMEPDDTRLPTASTCINLLKLPEYTSFEALKTKVLQ